ncbi:MAG TPA: sulfite exporter TauE/SafE family protein [Candidatus Dojkabacteria bacterium]|nr:sulfite exporter TauE/SafE family protein [Candidatus Dojkabacteria bacterium]
MSKKKRKFANNLNETRTCTYYVDGMHCASCEILIEKKALKKFNLQSVNASLNKGTFDFAYTGQRPNVDDLTKEFKDKGYVFSEKKFLKDNSPAISFKNGEIFINKEKLSNLLKVICLGILFIFLFKLFDSSGLASRINLTQNSSFISFFSFGIIAGFSSCAALIGGLLLSLSKQWVETYVDNDNYFVKLSPFIMFNIGRLISFFVLGGILGLAGKAFGLSAYSNPIFTAIIIILVSIFMALLGLQMLGVQWASRFQISLPKSITSKIANEDNFKGKLMPLIIGLLTFFLPCGFTITAQAIALTSGSFLSGALVMFFFALGTLPVLAFISFSSVSFSLKPKFNQMFNYVAGLLVIFFALYNLNAQLNVLGLKSLNDITWPKFNISSDSNTKLTSIVTDNSQTLETSASSTGYSPSNAVVKAGVPIVWNIKNNGAAGCTSGIISRDLLGTQSITLKPDVTTVNLPALKPGIYKYSCWMGMYVGTIKAI